MEDEELTQIRDNLQKNKPHKLPPQYKQISEELCITDQNILLRGNRIVLPTKLRQKAITLAHEDHAGMTKCKQRIRSKLWWPQMDLQIEQHVKSCHPCQVTSWPERPEPVCPTELPEKPWTHLAIDVCGPFPTGELVVVLTDYYSRWPEVKILKSVTSANILAWLDEVFATHGYPYQIKSDNASYFTSHEFRVTLKTWGVELKTVTEYWPQANGQVERFNQGLLKHILTANASNKDWRKTLPTMLRNYRSTPHQTTKATPAQLLMHRELRTKLPGIGHDQEDDSKVRATDHNAKQHAKEYADSKRRATARDLKPGDLVLLQQKHRNKYTSTFNPEPLKIIQVNGSQIVMRDAKGNTYRRNSSHVKRYREDPNPPPAPQPDEEEFETTPGTPNTGNPVNADTPPVARPIPDNPPPEPPNIPVRTSGRDRRPPSYLKDYIQK